MDSLFRNITSQTIFITPIAHFTEPTGHEFVKCVTEKASFQLPVVSHTTTACWTQPEYLYHRQLTVFLCLTEWRDCEIAPTQNVSIEYEKQSQSQITHFYGLFQKRYRQVRHPSFLVV